MATIPLSWNDPIFNSVTGSNSVEIQDGGTLSNYSSTDDGPIATVLLDGSATLNNVRINSNEGLRIGGSGNININNSYIETTGLPGDHADGIQAYSPGDSGNVTITNTTIVSHDQNATSGMFIADQYSGTFTFNNVVFEGGPFGLRIANDSTHDDYVSLSNVYFVGPFMYDPLLFQEVTSKIHITEWNNVRYATIVNGVLVPGALIPAPLPVEGGGTTPPPVTVTAPTIVSFSPDTGITGDGITSANNHLDIKGTADPNSTVTVYDGTTKLGTTTANATGSWDYITSILTDAKHVLTAVETSGGQNSAASAPLTVTVDTHAPAAPILTSDSVVNTNHILVSGTAEANSTITIYDGTNIVGKGTTGSNGTFSVTTSALPTGSHALTATATDAAGNISAASQPTDPGIPAPPTTTPPAAPHIVSFTPDSGAVGDHITNDNTPTLSGTALAGSTVNLFDGTTHVGAATADASGHWTTTTSVLGDGTHNLTATDTVSGQTSSASSAFAVTIDTHAPAAPTMGIYAQDGSAVGATTTLTDLVLKGSAEAHSTVAVFDGGNQVGTAATSNSGSWSFDTGHIATGGHSFTATATDVAGNTSAASAPDVVSLSTSTAPTPTPTSTHAPVAFADVDYTPWNQTATIKGTADAYSHIKLFDGNVSLGTATASANGTWSLTASNLSDTLHTITASETDSSGHVIGTSSGAAVLAASDTSILHGTGGDDFLFSASSQTNDTFVFGSSFGHSVVQGFTVSGPGQDTIQFSKSVFDTFASVLSHASQVGQDVVISSGSNSLTMLNTKLSALHSSDFHFA